MNLVTPASVAGKRVLLRADLNVPLTDGRIANDRRLNAILPTLRLLLSTASRVVLASHLGRPNPAQPDPTLSTRHLLAWFAQQGLLASFASNLDEVPERGLVLLENLRFWGEETSRSSRPFDGAQRERRNIRSSVLPSTPYVATAPREPACPPEPCTKVGSKDVPYAGAFVAALAATADCYVNDAFGTLHRADASIALLPRQFPVQERWYGLCVQQELTMLERLRQHPAKPFVALLGGSKVTDKLPLITQLITRPAEHRLTHLLLGGLLALDLPNQAPDLLALAAAHGVGVLTPTDYRYDDQQEPIDIGPATTATFVGCLRQAKTIFANGTMGKYEEAAGSTGTRETLQAIAQTTAFTVLGGGDCPAAAEMMGIADKVSFVSTGGGATLAYLAATDPWQDLPGLRALKN